MNKSGVIITSENTLIDAESQLFSMLSSELSKSINAQILKSISNTKNIRSYKIESILEKIKSSEL